MSCGSCVLNATTTATTVLGRPYTVSIVLSQPISQFCIVRCSSHSSHILSFVLLALQGAHFIILMKMAMQHTVGNYWSISVEQQCCKCEVASRSTTWFNMKIKQKQSTSVRFWSFYWVSFAGLWESLLFLSQLKPLTPLKVNRVFFSPH